VEVAFSEDSFGNAIPNGDGLGLPAIRVAEEAGVGLDHFFGAHKMQANSPLPFTVA
jgi:hypothetical protein